LRAPGSTLPSCQGLPVVLTGKPASNTPLNASPASAAVPLKLTGIGAGDPVQAVPLAANAPDVGSIVPVMLMAATPANMPWPPTIASALPLCVIVQWATSSGANDAFTAQTLVRSTPAAGRATRSPLVAGAAASHPSVR